MTTSSPASGRLAESSDRKEKRDGQSRPVLNPNRYFFGTEGVSGFGEVVFGVLELPAAPVVELLGLEEPTLPVLD